MQLSFRTPFLRNYIKPDVDIPGHFRCVKNVFAEIMLNEAVVHN